MIDLYIKQEKGMFTRVSGKDYRIMKTEKGDPVIVAFDEIILPLRKETIDFENTIGEALLANCIECVIYEDGNLSYVYKLNQDIGKTTWDPTSQRLHCPEAVSSFRQRFYKALELSDQ